MSLHCLLTRRTTRQDRLNREAFTRRRERRRLLALASTDFLRTIAALKNDLSVGCHTDIFRRTVSK